jgi:hypothetical protein
MMIWAEHVGRMAQKKNLRGYKILVRKLQERTSLGDGGANIIILN